MDSLIRVFLFKFNLESSLENTGFLRTVRCVLLIGVKLKYWDDASEQIVGKNSLIMNNSDLILRKSILTKNDTITQHK
jgi:hypothetical protein